MRLSVRRSRGGAPGTITGTVRSDRRTKRLARRLRPGDIAVIDHLDLDRVSAESLVAARVAAVLNAQPCLSGRYPSLGAELLVRAGVTLVDDLGDDVFRFLREGDQASVDGNTVLVAGAPVAHGVLQDPDTVAKAMVDAREGLTVQLEAFAATTVEYLRHSGELFLDGIGVPRLRTLLVGRPCVVVSRGYGYRAEIELLEPYLADARPVLIGVDGGADALLEAGHRPDLIIGDLEAVTDHALRCGAEIVIRVSPDGRTPALHRIAQLNLPAVSVPAAATGDNLAVLLADAAGASLVVVVGGHTTLGEFLDQGRAGAASTFLTRLKVGGTLVDAATVGRLHRRETSGSAMVLLAGSTMVATATGMIAATSGGAILTGLADRWDGLMTVLQGLF